MGDSVKKKSDLKETTEKNSEKSETEIKPKKPLSEKEKLVKKRKSAIKKQEKILYSVFESVDKNKLEVVKSLIENVAFMIVTLTELQETINQNGIVVEYKNGENQFGTKKSPEVETYIALQKNYQSAIKTLAELTPEVQKENKLDTFVNQFK